MEYDAEMDFQEKVPSLTETEVENEAAQVQDV